MKANTTYLFPYINIELVLNKFQRTTPNNSKNFVIFMIEFDKLGYIADSAIIGDSCGAHHSIRHQILISRVALTIGNDRRRHLVKY